MPTALALLPTAIGALGLIQNANNQTSARGLQQQALNDQAPGVAAQNAQLQLAQNYNPAAQDAQAFQGATAQTIPTLQDALQHLNATFGAGGGSPTGDTAFNFGAANTANNTLNPLRTWMANQISTEPQRQAAMFGNVAVNPGQASNTALNVAQMRQPTAANWQDSLAKFTAGLQSILPGGTAAGSGLPGAGVMDNSNAAYA